MKRFHRAITEIFIMAGVALFLSGIAPGSASAESRPTFSEVDGLTITVITDNYYDTIRPDTAICKRFRSSAEKSMHAEHGLAYYVETVSGGQKSAFMFDFGVDAQAVLRNMELLNIDLQRVDGIGVSHDHWDHWGAMLGILKANQEKLPKGTPLFVGQEAFSERFAKRPGSAVPMGMGRLKKEDVESLGKLRIVEVVNPTEIMKGGYSTGYIERVTDYEKVSPAFLIKRGERLEQDQIAGEQALFFNVKGKGLVVLAGCAHPGIVNTVKYVQKITGVQRVHAVLGGFHLVGVKPDVLQKTVAEIKAMGPDFIVPTHCTGFEAMVLFQKEMPKQFILNTAGTKYSF